MSVEKILDSSKITIKVENGFNEAGKPLYKSLTFDGLREDCNLEDIYILAEAIKAILANRTDAYLITEVSKIVNKD